MSMSKWKMTQMCVGVGAAIVALGCAGPKAANQAPAEEAAANQSVECPELTRLKYPFLTCKTDAYGNVVLDGSTILKTSQMPPLDPFVESEDYWGH